MHSTIDGLQLSAARASPGEQVRLPDGRLLGYAEYGDPDGVPMLGLHGTPGSRLMFKVADAQARELGIRLLAPERPGFGVSCYHRGRTLASYAADIAAFADTLGVARFAVAGISGGGPYAAACAALLPGRVTALGLVSPVGPVTTGEGAQKIGAGHHLIFRVSPRMPPLLWPIFAVGRCAFLYAPMSVYGLLLSRAALADRTILARGEVRGNMMAGIAEGMRPGVRAAVQEMRLFSRPWDIPFAAIRAPAFLWQGTRDRNVPPSAAFKLGELIPGCDIQRIEDAGHYWVFDNIRPVLARLADAARSQRGADAGGTPVNRLH
jgi:pimeloyl-ACP methyl ester carboxylesterase